MKVLYRTFCFVLFSALVGCQEKRKPTYEVKVEDRNDFQTIFDSLSPLHSKLDTDKEGNWLESNPETGQTFEQYVNSTPVLKTNQRSIIYVARLSEFDSIQQVIFELSVDYLSVFYQCETKVMDINIDYENIPEDRFRMNEADNISVLTDFFLKETLVKHIPDDAIALIGCTAFDIFPDPQWNFVFGQASLHNRVGVWSMARLGNPTMYPNMLEKSIVRNLKIASHETGHMMTMKHCIYYDCIMNGSAHILETDNKPVYLCPICLSKMNYNHDFALQGRFDSLEKFWNKYDYSIYNQYYEIVSEILIK